MESHQYFVHKAFAQLKRVLPVRVADALRRVATAVLTPIAFAHQSGHFRSSLRRAAVSKHGEPIPWYTFPAIDLLRVRDFAGRRVLEFGAGHSTLWWARRAEEVVAYEGDPSWAARIRDAAPTNVTLTLVQHPEGRELPEEIGARLASLSDSTFDVVVIDGLDRAYLVDVACSALRPGGAIIADNSEGYQIQERFAGRGMMRVDLYGYVPGVILPQCTSIFFREKCFLFDADLPIPNIAAL